LIFGYGAMDLAGIDQGLAAVHKSLGVPTNGLTRLERGGPFFFLSEGVKSRRPG
jgi:hypothetical protein